MKGTTDSMAGRVCMVTGSNSGIGKVTARELANVPDISEQDLEELRQPEETIKREHGGA